MTQRERDRERLLSRAFVDLADTLVDDYDVIDLLDRLVGHSVELLAVDAAGIMLADPNGRLRVVAASDGDAEMVVAREIRTAEGPSVDCVRTAAPVSVADLDDAMARWPAFADAMAGYRAVRSVHAVPLRLRGEAVGALSLFHRDPGALPDADLALGQALADVATVGILQERAIRRGEVLAEQLQNALHSRVTIEQAKGVLAQHGGLSMDAAFQRLRSYARSHNERLAEVARKIVDGDLPADALGSGTEHR